MQNDLNKMDVYLQHLPSQPLDKLKRYYEILVQFNPKINLVSPSTIQFAAKQHFADSVLGLEICFNYRQFDKPVYDMGSGNGFPGLVLATLNPDLPIHLVERDMRKSEFLKYVAAELNLKNVVVESVSIEDLPKNLTILGVTRALGSIGPLVIQMNSLFQSGGALFHFKGDSWSSELAKCPTQVFTSWDMQAIGHYTLPESTVERTIVVSNKL